MTQFPGASPMPKLPGVNTLNDGMGEDSLFNERPMRKPKFRQSSFEVAPSELKDILRLIGDSPSDVRTGKQVLGLQQDYPQATVPELLVMIWLNMMGRQYWYQQYAFGGRNAKGGFVADFTVQQGEGGLVINVNGDYWHSARKGYSQDYAARIALTGSIINGLRIFKFVQVWESDLYRMKERTIELALAGLELRGLS